MSTMPAMFQTFPRHQVLSEIFRDIAQVLLGSIFLPLFLGEFSWLRAFLGSSMMLSFWYFSLYYGSIYE